MVIGEQSALVLEEIQQIGHQLEIGRHIRIISAEMDIVELDMDDVLDAVVEPAVFWPFTLALAFIGRHPGR